MATVNPFTLAFVVSTKNELAIVHYISEHFDNIRRFSVMVNETESNALIEKFQTTGLQIKTLQSLDRGKGDEHLATKMGKNQVSAVIVMNYAAIKDKLTGDRLAVILEKAWNCDIPVCLNAANTELVINNLVTLKGLAGSTDQRKIHKSREKEMIALLQTRYPTFDIEISNQDKEKRRQRLKWTEQQLSFWLENSKLEFLKPVLIKVYDPHPDPQKYVTFHTPETDYFTNDETPKEEATNFFKLKSAPLNTSVDYLTVGPAARIRDIWDYSTFERDFLISHHLFISSVNLLKELRKRYNAPPPVAPEGDEMDYKPSSAVIVVIRDWILMEYGSDFAGNSELEKEFDDFMKNDLMKDDTETAKELLDMLHTAVALEPPYPVDLSKAPDSFPSKKNKFGKYDLHTSFTAAELARQMTLLDEHLFHKVRAKEFLGGAWTKKDALTRAPNLTNFINHTNRMAAWVVTEILRQNNQKVISELLTKFIHTGKELLELRNYSGVMNILTALHSATISRLRSAWQMVPNKERKDFEDLTESLSLLGHYRNYRDTLKSLPPSTPCIPLIPVTCSDLNGLGEVLENETQEGWINWDKHSKVANHIWSVKRFMRARYILKEATEIKNYISKAEVWEGEKTLAAIAKLREMHGGRISEKLAENNKKVKQPKEKDEKKATKDIKLSERDWALLNAGSETKKYSAGQEVLGLDVVNRHLFRVKKGTVRVEKTINGQLVVIDRMKEKSMFGEISMLLRHNEMGTTTAAIIADENGTEVIKYKIDFVMDMCRSEPTLSEKLHKIISLKLCERLRNFGSNTSTTIKRREEQSEDKDQSEDERSEMGMGIIDDKQDTPQIGKKDTRGSKNLSNISEVSLAIAAHVDAEKKGAKLEKKASQARMTAQKSRYKMDINQDDGFQKWFGLPDSEIIVRTFNCALKSTITTQGTLYLSQNYLCFSSNVFGRRTKDKFHFSNIQELKSVDKRLILTTKFGTKTIIKDFEKEGNNFEEVYTMIKNFFEQARNSRVSDVEKEKEEETSEHSEDGGLVPSEEDWKLILEGTRSIHYKMDEYVIVQNQQSKQRIYQIVKGSCRITKKTDDGQVLTLGVISSANFHDSILGEISFLEGTPATASVVANEDDTVVHIIEGFYLEVLFGYYPGLAGRFYHYMATVLSTRLKLREQSLLEKKGKNKKDADVKKDKPSLAASVSTPEEDDTTEEGTSGSGKSGKGETKKKKKRKSSKKVVVGGEEEWQAAESSKKEKKEKAKKEKTDKEEKEEEEDKQD